MGFGLGGIEALTASGVKDPRSTGSTTTSAFGELALGLINAAGNVGIAALQKKAGVSSSDVAKVAAASPGGRIAAPGQPTQKASVGGVNVATAVVAVLVVLLGAGAVYFAFRR